jgi:hypothetical protein
MSNSTTLDTSPSDEIKNRIYREIANLINYPIPEWDDLIEIEETYKSKLSPRYLYKGKLSKDGDVAFIYRLKPGTEGIKLAAVRCMNYFYLTHPNYSVDGNTKKTNICYSAPVQSHPQMDRSSEEKQNQFPELMGKIAFDIKEKCYNDAYNICGGTGSCCCFILFEITPKLPKMAEIGLSVAFDKLRGKEKTDGGSTRHKKIRRKGTKRKGTKRKGTKRKNAKHGKRVKF